MLRAAASIVVILGTLGADSARAQTPPAVPLSAGVFHTCAVTPSAGVKCWGANGDGALGDGTTLDRNLPADVVGLSSGVAAIAAGWYHTCALTTTGGVKCWGDNSGGQLGDGTNFRRTAPVDVTGLSSGVTAISAGGFHTCALMTAGGVNCWGDNNYGQIGDATYVDRRLPVGVTGLPSLGVGAIAAGYYHTCAVTKSAQVICWGANFSGQLGDGTTTDSAAPVYEAGLVSDAVAITAGEAHTCALTSRSGVKCWGDNGYGQLGDGTFENNPIALDVPGLSSGVTATSSHGISTCALTTAGSATCWGDNFRGQLGNDTTISTGAPVGVTGLSSGVAAIAAGYYHGCALSTSGAVKCWGWNRFGELGDGTNTNSLVPVDVPGTFAVPSVAADFVAANAGPGGTVTTDSDGGGASPADPIETTVTTPNGGAVSITEFRQSPLPGPFTMLDFVVSITAPPATAADPLTITFAIDGSALPAGVTAATLQVFRNGVLVPACTGAPAAEPDPCVSSRTTIADDAVLTVLTSRASAWTFGVNPAPSLSLPADMTVDATSPSGATVTYEATATDVIDGAVAVSCAPASGSMFSINPIGAPTTVTCSATDSDGNTASGTFTVHVRGGAEQIALLAQDAEAANSIIGEKVSDDLQTKLGDAASRLSDGRIDDACGKLSAFSGKVIAKTPKDIPTSLASDWLARADRIRVVLGCAPLEQED